MVRFAAAAQMALMGGKPNSRFLLVGVMTTPSNEHLRNRQRQWRDLFHSGVAVKLVLGKTYYGSNQSVEALMEDEQSRLSDLLFVDGREGLPHVGKVTEKSASWWISIAHQEPDFKYYVCCSDSILTILSIC